MSRATTKKDARSARRLKRTVGLLALGAGAAAAEIGFRQRVKADPQYEQFKHPLQGRPVHTESKDGTKLYAEVFGPEDGPTFVLAPGWTEQLRYFDPVTRILTERGFRVVAYDLRGQGKSGTPQSGDHVLERYGEDLDAVLDATCQGREDVIVAGHSMGGMSLVAWAGITKPSSKVKAAALMNTGQQALVTESRVIPARVPLAVREAIGVKMILGGTSAYLPVSNALLRGVSRYMAFGPDSTAAQLAFYEPMMWEMAPKNRGAAGLAIAKLDQLWALARLDVPTLVIAGSDDRMTPPSHAHKMAAELPQVTEVVVLPRTGHMAPLERSSQVADELCGLALKVGIEPAKQPEPAGV